MSILLFVVILVALIVIHELGHFSVAKWLKIRVDEFGVGFPPKIVGKKIGETEYTLNWLPLGGFVKIFGEDPDDESIAGPDKERSFVHKGKLSQIAVLAAGVFYNILFAWFLFWIAFMLGFPSVITDENAPFAEDSALTIVHVVPGSPAEEAGLLAGDEIISLTSGSGVAETPTSESVSELISSSDSVVFSLVRGVETIEIEAEPRIVGDADVPTVGIAMSEIGTISYGPLRGIYESLIFTVEMFWRVGVAILSFFVSAFTLSADLSQVAGPVGIVGLVGEAQALGFVNLLAFTALISLNLAVINLLPFPALDGGRILFVLIEWIKGSRIKPQVANTVNAVGFLLLILLMVVVTISDVLKLL